MSTENYCRTCAEKYPITVLQNLEGLQNEQLNSLILQHIEIKITKDNELTITVCKQCYKTFLNFHQFLNEVKVAQQKLREIFSECKTVDIKLESEIDTIEESETDIFLDQNKKNNDEIDIGSDYDNIDHFLNDFIDEPHDSDTSVTKRNDEELENKDSKPPPGPSLKVNRENISKNKNSNSIVPNKRKNLRKIHWKCYKCHERLRSEQCLQDHFQEVHQSQVEYVCVECNALFKHVREFKGHYYGHDVVKKSKTYRFNYTCETCGKQFYDLTNYRVHRDMHLGIKRFECEVCGKTFAKKQHKQIHQLTVCAKLPNSKKDLDATFQNTLKIGSEPSQHNLNENLATIESKWKCEKCDNRFETAYNLQKHLKKVHGMRLSEQICTVCDEVFDNNAIYDEHLKTVHDLNSVQVGSIYKCEKCSKQYKHKSTYLAHTLIHTGEKRFCCKDCGRKFRLKQHLVAHSLTHLESTNDYEVKCNQCDKMCKNQYLLNRHLKSHRPPDEKYKHKCDICKRKFMYMASLIAHQKQGHEREEIICDQCGKVFKNKYRLADHLNTHKDGVTYSCDECTKRFKSVGALKAHKKTHAEKTHKCEVCGKKFSLRGQLTVHSTIHTGKLPHECNFCKKQFRQKYYLKVHLRQHTGERPYSCLECNHYFANDGNFIKHLKGRHGLQNVSIVNKHRYPFDN